MNSKLPDLPPYARLFHSQIHKRSVDIVTILGLPQWSTVSPAEILLADAVATGHPHKVLQLGCYQGALSVQLAREIAPQQLTIHDHNHSALETTRLTLMINGVPPTAVEFRTDVDLPQHCFEAYDMVTIHLPKGRMLARRWLVQAQQALAPGGYLYLAGSNTAGIQSVIKDAEALFGEAMILGYKKGNRVAQLKKVPQGPPSPGWAQIPGIAPHTWVEFMVKIGEREYSIRSLPGIFSYDRLDEGTRLLLSVLDIQPGSTVLDAGCGYGMIGLFAVVHGAVKVDMIDNNLLAITACRETMQVNHVTNARIIPGDLLDFRPHGQYDLVVSNPPFHTGHSVDYQIAQDMITQSFDALRPNGRLVIVANRFIRYDRVIKQIFGKLEILTESGKFHVLSGLK